MSQRQMSAEEYNDCCPDHGGEIKRDRDFGIDAASVVTFTECKCALYVPAESWMHGVTLCDSYAEASGKATLKRMDTDIRYADDDVW